MKCYRPRTPRPNLVNIGITACVVTCHNYGRYLRKCLDSLLVQTLPFDYIVLVDDASDDDTAEIAKEYDVQYLRVEHQDFTAARNAGIAAVPRPRFLFTMDADNWIAPDYHAKLMEAMADPSVGVAYGTIMHVLGEGHPDKREPTSHPFDYWKLRRYNYVDACSLVRMEAFVQVGGWEAHDGMTDWLLWLKITRVGWAMKLVSDAHLYYRRHDTNMNALRRSRGRDFSAATDLLRKGWVTTVITLFSGREWSLPRYGQTIRELDWPHHALRIVAVDNSRDTAFGARLRATLETTGVQFTIVKDDSECWPETRNQDFADKEQLRAYRGYQLSEHLAKLYARARGAMSSETDAVWCLEDDIDPAPDTLNKLAMTFLCHRDIGVAVAGVRNRFVTRYLGWTGRWEAYRRGVAMQPVTELPKEGELLDLMATGFMCTFFRGDVWRKLVFRPAPYWEDVDPYYDWSAMHDVIASGQRVVLVGGTEVKHWQANGTFL